MLFRSPEAVGKLTLTLKEAAVAGITDVNGPAADGALTIGQDSAFVFAADYDVNNDGTVNQVDITEAQRYYQEKAASGGKAAKADVNGDGTVDLQDLIDIFRHLTSF